MKKSAAPGAEPIMIDGMPVKVRRMPRKRFHTRTSINLCKSARLLEAHVALQTCLERIERIEHRVDSQACIVHSMKLQIYVMNAPAKAPHAIDMT